MVKIDVKIHRVIFYNIIFQYRLMQRPGSRLFQSTHVNEDSFSITRQTLYFATNNLALRVDVDVLFSHVIVCFLLLRINCSADKIRPCMLPPTDLR
jgi:hypothetical protein